MTNSKHIIGKAYEVNAKNMNGLIEQLEEVLSKAKELDVQIQKYKDALEYYANNLPTIPVFYSNGASFPSSKIARELLAADDN